jgi:hypothetical protein
MPLKLTSVKSLASLVLALGTVPLAHTTPPVVINEIHFHPPEKRTSEFIELHNTTPNPIDLSLWTLEKFTFPPGQTLSPNGFLVVASNPASFQKEFGFHPLGPLPGKLKHRGETLRLKDPSGRTIDSVRYQNTFPWPIAASGDGPSLERVHPNLPSESPASWRSAGFPVDLQSTPPLLSASATGWSWRHGRTEASSPSSAWKEPNFNEDATWQPAMLSIGYGDDDDATVLTDMQGQYTCLFLRKSFSIDNPSSIPALVARIRVDDGCILWLNGHEILRLNLPPGNLPHTATASDHEAGPEPESYPLPNAHQQLRSGENLLAAQVFNNSKHSSDLTFDIELRSAKGAPLPKSPSPGRANSVLSPQAAPAFLDVQHNPAQPRSGESVTITARAERGLKDVTLEYQIVEPGNYIRLTDPSFAQTWTSLKMSPQPTVNPSTSQPTQFIATLPKEIQTHRRLIRYRIRGQSDQALTACFPREDDPCPNRAWFVYDAPPRYVGSIRPGKSEPLTFTKDFLQTLPAYHLIARGDDVANSQWNGTFHRKPFRGTLVVDGIVHDHIIFHNRGQGSAHISGKNKWGIKLGKHQPLAAKRNDGTPYENAWDSINLNPGLSTPYLPIHCGIGGLDEALSFRAYQLAGVPASNTHWIQWRIISAPSESEPKDQFTGDLQGLYLAIQDLDGDWLKELQLPDGNVYSTQSGRKHLARGASSDHSDWNTFLNGVRQDHPEAWWRENINLPAFYSFHAMNRLLANVDLRPDGNLAYYHPPDGRWAPIPWDLDMMFVPRHHQPGIIDVNRCLNVPSLKREFANRAREILDLFCADPSPTGGQIGQLLHELANVIHPKDSPRNWAELDAVHWNFHPRKNGHDLFFRKHAVADHFGGRWERQLASADFAGFCRYLLEFTTDSRPTKNYQPNDGNPLGYGFGYLRFESEDKEIPERPTIAREAGSQLIVSAFESRSNHPFRALEWRLAEIAPPSPASSHPSTVSPSSSDSARSEPSRYELTPIWTFREENPAARSPTLPHDLIKKGRTYRLRARFEDLSGRKSHWSPPLEIP